MKHENHTHTTEKPDVQVHLENLFQALQPREDAPEEIKEAVFSTLDTINLVGGIVDLFTAKFAMVETEFLDLLNEGD